MEFEERYFREELDYLRQLSKLLATEKPHLARFLAEKDADPDIERLLEGVAFLTGNLRQKIEDEFPELTHGLIKMLWPNYLRPVPAMTLIEYTPDMDKSSVPVLIPRNEQFTTNAGEIRVDEVLPSDAKKEEPPPCTFTLCRDIWLLPVRLEQIENRSTTRNGVINITFSVAPGTDFRTLDLNKLRFWLGNDDNYTRDQLYLWFCEYLQGADLTVGEQHIRLPEFMLKAVGFEPQDAMLPWPKNVHSGYRILQEYFCYPDAFLFFDLCGCPALPDGLQAEFFTLQLRFTRPLPVDIRLRRDSLRLYCAPAINLFIHHAEAITLDNRRADYPLVPSRHYPQHYDVFSVNSVVSQVQDMFRKKDLGRPVSTQAARQWPAFESFSHQMEYSRKREVVYWHHRTKTSLFHRGFDHTLAFIHADGSYPSDESLLSNEVVSVSLTCTNRELPSQIRSGDITGTTGKNAAVASFRNITRPTQPLWPVIDGSLHWSLLSAMNLNYLSLLDPLQALQSESLITTGDPLSGIAAVRPSAPLSDPASNGGINTPFMDLPPIYASPGDRNDDVSAAEMAQRHLAVTPLLRGLGGSLTMSNSDDADDFLEEAGRTLQAAIKGLLDLQQQRNSLSDKHLRPLEDNPLRLNMDYATALDVMFAEGKSPVHLAAPAAVSESLRNVRHHEEANRAAIVESLRVLLDAFSPQNLLRRFVQYRRSHELRQPLDDAGAWQMYSHYYEELASDRQQGFEMLFNEVYAQVYDRVLREKQREPEA
ncbi:type VI secretion system baseplate subunit TssF [Escherichia coli]